jgi:UPF0716 protein FxsA
MAKSLFFLLVAGVVLDIASIIWVGNAFGTFLCIALLIAGGAAGISIIRSAGTNLAKALGLPVRSLWAQQGAAGRTMLRTLAGLLLLMPGFFSDLVALLLLLPPIERWFARKVRVATTASPVQTTARFGTVIEGEATEIRDDVRAAPHESIDWPDDLRRVSRRDSEGPSNSQKAGNHER